MEKSQTISELSKALCDFQGKCQTIGYDANNPFFKSKYATLANLVESTRKELSNSGLSVSQLCEDENSVTTILMHKSGEFLSSKLTLKPVKDDPQARGSCITYARRYSYASILGLVSDNDDDGNEATRPSKIDEIKKMKYHTEELALKVFDTLDAFKKWRIDNEMPEDLYKLSEIDCSKVYHAVKQFAVKKGIKL